MPLRGLLSILAHNVALSFQLDTIVEPRRRSRKRTYAYLLRSMRTLRFLLITRAGRLTRIGGRNLLRLAQNPATEALYSRVEHALAGVKRARIVKDVLRNTKVHFSDLVMAVACGLHNLRVQVRKRRLKI